MPDPGPPAVEGPSTSRVRGYRDLLSNRNWLLWEFSATTATVGYFVYAISVPWFAYQFSANFLIVGLVLFVEFGIYTLTFLAGPLVDRARDKRTIYLVCYPAQGVAAVFLGLAIERGFLSLPLLLGLIAFLSFLWDFTWAANNVAPRLLLDVDQLFRASGLGTLLGGVTQLAGYAVGAALIVLIGPAVGFLLYGGLLFLALVLVVPVALRSPPMSKGGYLDDFREGWRHFTGAAGKALRGLASVELLRGFFGAAPTVLIVVVAARLYAGATSAYGLLFAAEVVGGIAVGLFLGEWNPRRSIGGVLIGSVFASAALVVLAVSPAVGLVGGTLVWFFFGAAGSAYTSAFYVYLRGAYPSEAIGRITANLYLFTGISASAGSIVIGLLAERWSLEDLGLLVGVGMAAAGALLAALPSLRRLVF